MEQQMIKDFGFPQSIGKPSAYLKHERVIRISEITLTIVNRRGLVEERAAFIIQRL